MLTFHVLVNDDDLANAGAGDVSVLAATVTYVAADDDLELRVGGMTHSSERRAHVDWITRKLRIGDVVTLRVVESAEASAPVRTEPIDPRLEEQQTRAYYEILKKRFEP